MSEPDVDEAVTAAFAASRALVGVAARSLAAMDSQITLSQYRALVLLRTRGPLNVGALAEALDIQPSSVTGLCDRLATKHFIARGPSPTSRREVSVAISAAGRALVDSVANKRRRELRRVLRSVDGSERQQIVDGFAMFAQAAGEVPDDAWKLGWT
jgi:DNA-binding MarR family transcriptional regulator